MRWESPKVAGKPPSARGGATACLSGNRLMVYGGMVEPEAAPCDELWSLDLETATWVNHNIRGVGPGGLAYGAAACIGNNAYFFGGCVPRATAPSRARRRDASRRQQAPADASGRHHRPACLPAHVLVAESITTTATVE